MYDPKRTQVAQSLVDFGKYFDTIFAATRVAGEVPMRPMLVVPDDMSTDGGKRARQSIVLQPEYAGPPAITVGWIDIPGRQAMVRTYACLAGMHQQRFPGRPFPVDQASFDKFFRDNTQLLKTCGLAATIEDRAPDALPTMGGIPSNRPVAPASRGYSGGVVALIALTTFVLGALAGAAAVWLRWRSG